MNKFIIWLLAVAMTLTTVAVVSAHQAQGITAEAVCDGATTIRVNADVWGGVHLIVKVDDVVISDEAITDNDKSVREFVFNTTTQPGDHTASAKTSDQRESVSTTFTTPGACATPTPKPTPTPRPVKPHGSINGPCGDPMYRATVKAGSVVKTYLFIWKSGDNGKWHTTKFRLAPFKPFKTNYKHVLQFTKMTLRTAGGTVLATRTAAKGGNYGTCPK